TNLTTLTLNNNQLAEVPDSLAQLTNLTTLYLNNNQLAEVPDSLTQLTNLTTLTLNNNQLAEVPDSLAQLTNLTTLTLNNNQLAEVPDSLTQLTNLTTLYLNDNNLRWLPEQLSQTTLRSVSVSPTRLAEVLSIGGANRFPVDLLGAAENGIDALWNYLKTNNPPADEDPVSVDRVDPGFTIRDRVPSGVEFQPLPDPDTMFDVRGLLEQLVGLATDLIQQGKFDHDPLLEDRIGRDRDSLRYELFENPDGFDSTMIAIVTQRTLSTVIPVLPDGPEKDLAQALAGVPDRNPQSAAAAEAAIDKAQAVADALDDALDDGETLAERLSEHLGESLDADLTSSEWIASTVKWSAATVEGLGLGTTVTGTLFALGATGPTAIVIGVVLGILTLFRPRNP
ncbi:MAG: leucine-rich repeat domain-containing protein, partial [Actinomycetota bacterium]